MSDLQTLLAKDAIRDLVLMYCRAIDRKDYDLLSQLYAKDAIDDHGGMFCGSAEEFLKWLPGMLESMKVTAHQVTNHLIKVLDDGVSAEGEVTCIAYHLSSDDQEIIIGGRYLDKYTLVDGSWKFLHRKIVMDWNQIQSSRCDLSSPVVAGTPVGDRVGADPSADFFQYLFT